MGFSLAWSKIPDMTWGSVPWWCAEGRCSFLPAPAWSPSDSQSALEKGQDTLTWRIRQKLHLLLPQQGPSFCECPLWRGPWHSAVWGSNSVVCKEELWIITFHIQSSWHVCWYKWLHMVLTTGNWFFFAFNLCTSFYWPRLWGTNQYSAVAMCR